MDAFFSLLETIWVDRIIGSLMTLVTIFNLLPGIINNVKTYSPAEENIILNCAVISDTHTDGNIVRDRSDILRKTYAGISRCTADIDVVLNIGDITNSGGSEEYRNCRKLMNRYLKAGTFVACIGNHDSWNGSADPDYEKAKQLFIDYVNEYGNNAENVYYSRIIKGYYFICLGTEGLDLHEITPIYSETQLKWFDDELAKAEQTGKPVFVLSHKLTDNHNGFTGSNEVPAEVDTIMQKHSSKTPILFFSGHHHTFSQSNYDREGNVYYFNLPSAEYNDETVGTVTDKGGMGLTMEVYEDKIIINSRNFIKDLSIDGYKYVINTKSPN